MNDAVIYNGRFYERSLKCLARRVIYLGLIVLLIPACKTTFQSNQYDFVTGLFANEKPVLEKNWRVLWRDQLYDVYAVNHAGGTFFANESGLVVTFDGWQITGLSLPGYGSRKAISIEAEKGEDGSILLRYYEGENMEVAKDQCQRWKREAPFRDRSGWRQVCSGVRGNYQNEIWLNELGQLVSLRFVLRPSFQTIKVDLR